MGNASNFAELNNNMQDILLKLISNENIAKLLYYSNSTPLESPTVSNPIALLDTKIYTQTYIPETDTQICMINVWFDDFRKGEKNTQFKCNKIRFSIVCHRDLWQTESGMRPIMIAHEIDKLFNFKKNIGIGKNYFIKMDYRAVNNLYNSYLIDYEMWDFS